MAFVTALSCAALVIQVVVHTLSRSLTKILALVLNLYASNQAGVYPLANLISFVTGICLISKDICCR